MPRFLKDHVVFFRRTESLPYTSIQQGRNTVVAREGVDRHEQGNAILDSFTTAVEDAGYAERDFIYITFLSVPGFFIDIEKLDKGNFKLSSYKKLKDSDTGEELYEATVRINRDAVSDFLRRVDEYIKGDTIRGNPKNRSLIANIEDIRAATLLSFWEEPEINFPGPDKDVWWEVWFHREKDDVQGKVLEPYTALFREAGIQFGRRFLQFPEHWVCLVKGTVAQLGASLLYTNRLAEIRKPQQIADFFTYLDISEQENWINDLVGRVTHNHNTPVSISLLDTGVNRSNPLLLNLIPENHLDKVEPEWTTADTHRHGHGTPMAGLALYGNLTEHLASSDQVTINWHLESIKLIHPAHAHDPELYGAVTQEAIARAEVINPKHRRLVCMAVTSDEFVHKGRPSSWSSAIDQTIFGFVGAPNQNTLFFVSSGNLALEDRMAYPIINSERTIEDPGQAFNAITVGSYTLLDHFDHNSYPGAELLAERGAMSPCNTTSEEWSKDWCRKPDIVMEGGNHACRDNGLLSLDSLQLLSTSKGGVGRSWLYSFGDTSASTALAAKFAAELYATYQQYWPETIRGLIVHSADWTPAMLNNRPIASLTEDEKRKLLTSVGYGVPNMGKARYSTNNSVSLIAERELRPYKMNGSTVKTNDFHLFDLPWPQEVLQQLFDMEVKLIVTLSYFIEPNPGNKRYELAASYRSHGLRFKMIDSNESVEAFTARISKDMRDEDYLREGGEHWELKNAHRDKGSIHKDIWRGTAADLATRNKIAVHPVGGWWKTRPTLERYYYSVRYSLIITIDTPSEDIDIFTPIMNLVSIEV